MNREETIEYDIEEFIHDFNRSIKKKEMEVPEITDDDYVGRPKEVDEGIIVSSRRNAFKDGAKYAFKKAADWFGNNAHKYMYIESHEYSRDFGYDTDKLIEDFKKDVKL